MLFISLTLVLIFVLYLFFKSLTSRKINFQNEFFIPESKLEHLEKKAFEKYLIKDYKSATAIADRILILNPNYYDVLTLRAMCLENLNYNLDAIKDYERAIKLKVDYNIFGLLGMCYNKIGDFEKAIVKLKIAVEKGFKIYEPTYNLISNPANKEMITILREANQSPENLIQRNGDDFNENIEEVDQKLLFNYLKNLVEKGETIYKSYPNNHELQEFYKGAHKEFLRVQDIDFKN